MPTPKGFKHSQETKIKMSRKHKGKKFTTEHRKNISKSKMGEKNPFYDKHHSEEMRKKWSTDRKGKKNPMFNKHHSEETKKIIGEKSSVKNKGRIPWNKGIPLDSEETRKKMSDAHTGKNNINWKGGILKRDGRVFIWKPEHPYANKQGYILRYRLIMEEVLERYLKPNEVIHHKNKITNDDRLENLQLFESSGKHSSFHEMLKKIEKQSEI